LSFLPSPTTHFFLLTNCVSDVLILVYMQVLQILLIMSFLWSTYDLLPTLLFGFILCVLCLFDIVIGH
jgi:hypothetical protein